MSVPKLRFPGFAGEWRQSALSSLASVERGKFSARPRNDPRFYGGNTPFVQTGDVARANRYLNFYSQTLNDFGVHVSRVFPENTVIMTIAANIGDVCIATFPVAFPDSLVGINTKPGTSTDFLYSYLTTRKEELFSYATQNAQANINLQVLNPLKIPHPTLPEQQKIAAFLGAVDAKLAALAARQAALGRFKAGLMQKLFSQQLRFTRGDGKAFPDWEEKQLGEIFTWVKTNSLSREFLTHDGGEVQNIHYGDIHTKFRPLFRQSFEIVPFVGANSALKPFTDDEYCRVGDVVIADASEDYADIGKAIEIVEVRERSLVAGLHTYIARPQNGSLVVGFSGYLLRSAPMRQQIRRIAQGISVLGVSKGNLEELTFWVPHPAEQQKIAAALSAMDTKIQAVADQLTKLQTFKKGLLQQMFV